MELMVERRPTLDEIVRIRDGKRCCDQCFEKMRYRPVSGAMKGWAPAPYAWFCPKCRMVLLDGSIDPGEPTWDYKMKEDDKRRLTRFLHFAMKQKNKPGG